MGPELAVIFGGEGGEGAAVLHEVGGGGGPHGAEAFAQPPPGFWAASRSASLAVGFVPLLPRR